VTRWLRDDRRPAFLLGSVLVLLVSSRTNAFALCVPLVLLGPLVLERWAPSPSAVRLAGYAALGAVVLIVFPMATQKNLAVGRQLTQSLTEWRSLSQWARIATPASAVFLTPARPQPKPDQDLEQFRGEAALNRAAIFEYEAHRRVFVDYKRGAAAMWSPSYYSTWLPRYNQVEELSSLEQRLDYARANRIDYVVERCQPDPAARAPLFRTARLCVYSARTAEPAS
jgi:hypothetical protein